MKKPSWETLLEVEKELNTISFEKIPLGGIACDFLYTGLFFNEPQQSTLFSKYIFGPLIELKQILEILFLGYKKNKHNNNLKTNSILISVIFNKERFVNFFSPIIELWKEKTIILNSREQFQFSQFDNIGYMEKAIPTFRQYIKWRKSYSPIKKKLFLSYQILASKHGFDTNNIEHLDKFIRYQTLQSIYFIDFLIKSKPESILVDIDRSKRNSIIVLCAKKLNIPTFTCIHGSTEPAIGFVPIIANYLICWGKTQYDQFLSLGIPKEQMAICGNTNLKVPPTNRKVTNSININLFFASNNVPLDDRRKLFQLFETGTSNIYNISSSVKLHPSENKEEYSGFIQQNSHISIYSQNEISLDVLFEQADIILAHNSSIMFESISKGLPVLILNPIDVNFPAGIGQKLYDMPGYPKIQNETDLKNYIKAIQKDMNLLDDLYKICIEFSKDYCHSYDIDAAKNIANLIQSKSNSN